MVGRVLVVTATVLLGAAAACGGKLSSQGTCAVPAGTYTEHFVAQSTQCPKLADVSYSFATATELAVVDAGAPQAGCSATVQGCTVSFSCTRTSGSVTSTSDETLVYASDGSATGTLAVSSTGGTAPQSCTYDVTVTKH